MSKKPTPEPGAPRPNKGRATGQYEALKQQAMVLYLKHCLSAAEISQRLKVSMPTLAKWKAAGKWDDYRPDLEILKKSRAAALYIHEGMAENEIAERLSISTITVKQWVDFEGWAAARLVGTAQNTITNLRRSHQFN